MAEEKKMSCEEAGKKGGETTAENQDKEFYQEIGEKGGKNS
ncbi:KGG domain-containing protein [Staphylococcus sp. Marseille-Q1834]|nr:KGG domain-containing protein [Staphylococcus sp. Marseille-Q1834]